jgi:hypothetical protein
MSTGPAERGNDARETKIEPVEGTALDCSSGLGSEAIDVNSVGALASGSRVALQGAGRFPKTTCGHGRGRSCRSAHQAAPGTERGQGSGGGAAQERAGHRPGPCGLARAAGRGRVGVGNERHAFTNAKDLTPATSRDSIRDHFWRPWETFYLQPASNAGRFISRCSSASLHSAAGPLRGHRPAEAPSALHHLICRASFDTWRHVGAPWSSSFKEPAWGLAFGVPR